MENERALYGNGKPTGIRSLKMRQHLPSQTDESGSAIRIRNQRPQTPRINLLKQGHSQPADALADHPLFSQQAQLKVKPNFLNPHAKIG